MKQSVLVGSEQSWIEERDIPPISARDVLVRVQACGVCASELHVWHTGENCPREFGHEVAGEVVEVGAEVQNIRPGMKVTGLFQKGFAEYAVADESRIVPIPENLEYDDALGEPLACVMSAARRTRIDLADTVAVVGIGFMGLLMLQAIRLKGPARTIGIDIRDDALYAAKRLGADEVLHPQDVGKQLKLTSWDQLRQDYGVDVVVEASGTLSGLTLAGEMVREHGVLSIVGYHQGGPREVDMQLWNWKALEVLNAHERRPDYQIDCMRRGLKLVAVGKLEVAPLVSHRFNLEHVDDAFKALQTKPSGFTKAVITINDG